MQFLRDLVLTWLGVSPHQLRQINDRVDELNLKVQYLESRLQEYIDCGVHSLHGRHEQL